MGRHSRASGPRHRVTSGFAGAATARSALLASTGAEAALVASARSAGAGHVSRSSGSRKAKGVVYGLMLGAPLSASVILSGATAHADVLHQEQDGRTWNCPDPDS